MAHMSPEKELQIASTAFDKKFQTSFRVVGVQRPVGDVIDMHMMYSSIIDRLKFCGFFATQFI